MPLILWVVLLLLLDSHILVKRFSAVHRPDLLLLFIIFLAIRFDSSLSLLTGFLLGGMKDSLMLNPLGLSGLYLVIVGLLPHVGRHRFFLEDTVVQWVLVLGGTVVGAVVRVLVYWGLGQSVGAPWPALVWGLVLHSLLFWPLFRLWDITLGSGKKGDNPQ